MVRDVQQVLLAAATGALDSACGESIQAGTSDQCGARDSTFAILCLTGC